MPGLLWSCGHAGCWGPAATGDCQGVRFERAALALVTEAQWQEMAAAAGLVATP